MTATKDEWTDILFGIYMACKDIPDWIDNLKEFHDTEDMQYFERMVRIESLSNGKR